MKRTTLLVAACLLPACSQSSTDESERVGVQTEDLNGSLAPKGFLVKKSFAQPDEVLRQSDTLEYYARTSTQSNGTDLPALARIVDVWHTLADFRRSFQFGTGSAPDITSRYYNRGDLGLGREMHCVDRHLIDGQIACYVTNYAAGDDGSEFTFGMSSAIAFRNMNSVPPRPVATVAMVWRGAVADGQPNKVVFVVFDGQGNRTNTAPLDRHGLNFATAFKNNNNVTPPPSVAGTPGVEFNNHIPSNCLSCHGGTYNPTTRQVGGFPVFLPFDLDQFEYDDASGHSRAHEAGPMRTLNEMVRKVSAFSSLHPIPNQLDTWYQNTQFTFNVGDEVFENQFDSSQVPSGWKTSDPTDTAIYRSVVRGKCRGCHVASSIPFDDAASFRAVAGAAANEICRNAQAPAGMPHALQTTREFWQSAAPSLLEQYFRPFNATAADTLRNCSIGSLVTLDPDLIVGGVP